MSKRSDGDCLGPPQRPLPKESTDTALGLSCPACKAKPGDPCMGAVNGMHPSRLDKGRDALHNIKYAAWEASPAGQLYRAQQKALAERARVKQEKAAIRREAAEIRRVEREEQKKQYARDLAEEIKREWAESGDNRTWKERVLDALHEIGGDGASAFSIAKHIGVHKTPLLQSVHSALRALWENGEIEREIVDCFVPHSWTGNTSSVYSIHPQAPQMHDPIEAGGES